MFVCLGEHSQSKLFAIQGFTVFVNFCPETTLEPPPTPDVSKRERLRAGVVSW